MALFAATLFILSVKFVFSQEIHCNYEYLEMKLMWPYTLFLRYPDVEYDYNESVNFLVIRSIIPKGFEEFSDHYGECFKLRYIINITDPIAFTYFPEVWSRQSNNQYWRSHWNQNALCAKTTDLLRDPSQYYIYFLDEAEDFNLVFFRNLINSRACALRQFIPRISPGYFVCQLDQFRRSLANYPVANSPRATLRCKYGTLNFRRDGGPYNYTILRSAFLYQIKRCYDREGAGVDCPDEDNCSLIDNTKIYIPRGFFNYELIPVDPLNMGQIRNEEIF